MKYWKELTVVIIYTLLMYWASYGQADDKIMDLKVSACNIQYLVLKTYIEDNKQLPPRKVKHLKREIRSFGKNCIGLDETLKERKMLYQTK